MGNTESKSGNDDVSFLDLPGAICGGLLGSDDEETNKSKKGDLSKKQNKQRKKRRKKRKQSSDSMQAYDDTDDITYEDSDEELYVNDTRKKESPSERRSRRKAKREERKKRREKKKGKEHLNEEDEEDSLASNHQQHHLNQVTEGKSMESSLRSESKSSISRIPSEKKELSNQVTFEVPTTDDDSTLSPSKNINRDRHGMLKPILSNEEKKDYEMRLVESERVFLKEFKLMMVDGFRVQKHGRRGKPHFRTIRLSPDTGCLYWGSQKANSKSEFILIEDIREVRRGAFDGVLMTKERSDCCFSLITDKRRLDFETADPDTRSLISDGFMLLLKEKRCM